MRLKRFEKIKIPLIGVMLGVLMGVGAVSAATYTCTVTFGAASATANFVPDSISARFVVSEGGWTPGSGYGDSLSTATGTSRVGDCDMFGYEWDDAHGTVGGGSGHQTKAGVVTFSLARNLSPRPGVTGTNRDTYILNVTGTIPTGDHYAGSEGFGIVFDPLGGAHASRSENSKTSSPLITAWEGEGNFQVNFSATLGGDQHPVEYVKNIVTLRGVWGGATTQGLFTVKPGTNINVLSNNVNNAILKVDNPINLREVVIENGTITRRANNRTDNRNDCYGFGWRYGWTPDNKKLCGALPAVTIDAGTVPLTVSGGTLSANVFRGSVLRTRGGLTISGSPNIKADSMAVYDIPGVLSSDPVRTGAEALRDAYAYTDSMGSSRAILAPSGNVVIRGTPTITAGGSWGIGVSVGNGNLTVEGGTITVGPGGTAIQKSSGQGSVTVSGGTINATNGTSMGVVSQILGPTASGGPSTIAGPWDRTGLRARAFDIANGAFLTVGGSAAVNSGLGVTLGGSSRFILGPNASASSKAKLTVQRGDAVTIAGGARDTSAHVLGGEIQADSGKGIVARSGSVWIGNSNTSRGGEAGTNEIKITSKTTRTTQWPTGAPRDTMAAIFARSGDIIVGNQGTAAWTFSASGYSVDGGDQNSYAFILGLGNLYFSGTESFSNFGKITIEGANNAGAVLADNVLLAGEAPYIGHLASTASGPAGIVFKATAGRTLINAGSRIDLRTGINTGSDGGRPGPEFNMTGTANPVIYVGGVGSPDGNVNPTELPALRLRNATFTGTGPERYIDAPNGGVEIVRTRFANAASGEAIVAMKDIYLAGVTGNTDTDALKSNVSRGPAAVVRSVYGDIIVASDGDRPSFIDATTTSSDAVATMVRTLWAETGKVFIEASAGGSRIKMSGPGTAVMATEVNLIGSTTVAARIEAAGGKAIEARDDVLIVNGRVTGTRTSADSAIVNVGGVFRMAVREGSSGAARAFVGYTSTGTSGAAIVANDVFIASGDVTGRSLAIKTLGRVIMGDVIGGNSYGTSENYHVGFNYEPNWCKVQPQTNDRGDVTVEASTITGISAQPTLILSSGVAVDGGDSIEVAGRVTVRGGTSGTPAADQAVVIANRGIRVALNDAYADSIHAGGTWTAILLRSYHTTNDNTPSGATSEVLSGTIRATNGIAIHTMENFNIHNNATVRSAGAANPTVLNGRAGRIVTLGGVAKLQTAWKGILGVQDAFIRVEGGGTIECITDGGRSTVGTATAIEASGRAHGLVQISGGTITNKAATGSGTPSLIRVTGASVGPDTSKNSLVIIGTKDGKGWLDQSKIYNIHIETSVAAGRAITLTGNGNVLVRGGTILASGATAFNADNSGGAVAIVTSNATLAGMGAVIVDGGAQKVEIGSNVGTGIQTNGGAVIVQNSDKTAGVSIQTTSGTAINSRRPNTAPTARAGKVVIGTLEDGADPDDFGIAEVLTLSETSGQGIGIFSPDTVEVWKGGKVETYAGKGIQAGHVRLMNASEECAVTEWWQRLMGDDDPDCEAGNDNDLAAPEVIARGITVPNPDSPPPATNIAAIVSRSVIVDSGHVKGNEGSTQGGAQYGPVTCILVPAPGKVAGMPDWTNNVRDSVVVRWGANIYSAGAGFGIHNSGAENIEIIIGGQKADAGDRLPCTLSVGNAGTAIHSLSRVSINNNTVIKGEQNAIGINMLGKARPLTIGNIGGNLGAAPEITVMRGPNSRAVVSADSVPVFINYGNLTVEGGRGIVVHSSGGVRLGDEDLKTAATLIVDGDEGTGLYVRRGDALILNASILSNDKAIVSEGTVVNFGNGVAPLPAVSNADNSTPWAETEPGYYVAKMTGVVDANAVIRENGSVFTVRRPTNDPADERGGKLTLAEGRDINVLAGGRLVVTAPSGSNADSYQDSLILLGSVSTVNVTQTRTPMLFNDGGFMFIGPNSDISFDTTRANTFKAATAGNTTVPTKYVLYAGATFNGQPIDYLRWADTLSNNSSRGIQGVKVIIPPQWANSSETWGFTKWEAVETVYNIIDVRLPLNARFEPYSGVDEQDIEFALVGGALPEGCDDELCRDPLKVSPDGGIIKGLITEVSDNPLDTVGIHKFTAQVTNLAGPSVEKEFTIRVERANIDPDLHLRGYVMNLDEPVYFSSTTTEPAATPYTGEPVPATIVGDTVRASAGGEGSSDNWVKYPMLTFDRFGSVTPMYQLVREGVASGNLTNVPPTDVGEYNVYVAMANGRNFNPIAPSHPVYVGQMKIEPVSISELLGAEVPVLQLLEAGKAIDNVTINLPALSGFGAIYNLGDGDFGPSGGLGEYSDIFVEGSADVAGNVFTFAVTDVSKMGERITFQVPVRSINGNINEGEVVTVHVTFTDAEGLKERVPVVSINYETASLTHFEERKGYTVTLGNASTDVPTTGADFAILESWFGNSVSVVTKASNQYMTVSDPQVIAIPARPEAPDASLFTVENATTNHQNAGEFRNGAILGGLAGMEFRAVGSDTWLTLSPTKHDNLLADSYEVRYAAVFGSSFPSPSIVVEVGLVGVAEENREIVEKDDDEIVGVVETPRTLVAQFSMGPNPASRTAGSVKLFWQGKAIKSGSLGIYDASGSLVRKINVTDNATQEARREIGSWNFADSKGRAVADGTYLVRGNLRTTDGNTVKVSYLVGVK